MDLLEAARVESINILKEMAEGIWTGEHLDNPSDAYALTYLMAWSQSPSCRLHSERRNKSQMDDT